MWLTIQSPSKIDQTLKIDDIGEAIRPLSNSIANGGQQSASPSQQRNLKPTKVASFLRDEPNCMSLSGVW